MVGLRINRAMLFLVSCLWVKAACSQICTAPGQTPKTAITVCSTQQFYQQTTQLCTNGTIPGPCTAVPSSDKNPFWYKMMCFKSGTLGFVVTPNNLADDYDWQLFDITGKDPNDVYFDPALAIACNWSGDPGATGASGPGTNLFNCDGLGIPLFSKMPLLQLGRVYLLLVSHFSDSNAGYTLNFTGGTGAVTDPVTPHLVSSTSDCSGNMVFVKVNKNMLCNSLASDGSDFLVSPHSAGIISAEGKRCSGPGIDSVIILKLSSSLPAGNYNIAVKKGNDNNSLLDNCGNGILEGETISMEVKPCSYFTFNGNGSWTDPENWIDHLIPPITLPAYNAIIIDPVQNGECLLNVKQKLLLGSSLTVMEGKKFLIQGELIVQ